ncbi:MAG: DEAD/DEAH box helicase [Armatimonadetes bacterium]|nr:DEAD/DEAH box helicase [Armatimonadota bacterium]
MRWTELRPIQVDAIHEILQSDNHLIITAMTAGGKTEAAFLPVLSSIVDDCQEGIRALYVGPLKALINDQFLRLEDLCERSGIPVHKWHGDVSQSAKSNLLKKPSGVLLITPESIESLFVNRSAFLPSLFAHLSYCVIDETHAFMGTERGAHMKSLITRLSKFSANRVRIIGLSATIGDIESAKMWLCPRDSQNVGIIKGENEKSVRYLIKGYLRSFAVEQAEDVPGAEARALDDIEATPDDLRLTDDIIKTFYGKTALIFANSRARLEYYADLTRRMLERRSIPDRFRIHHGSLSKSEREEAEDALRSDMPTATFCSSTLELGIDVGNVSRVGQIGCPWSVSSLTQRLGRSGRRGNEASEMWVYIEEDEPSDKSRLVDRLFPELLQSIAMTEMMLEKWCEPPDVDRFHLSTLVQQVMSIIAERGGATALVLYSDLIENGAFGNVSKAEFVAILNSMGATDLIEQTPEGELILGLNGERIVRSFDFYSAFASSEEMQVIHKGHRIGSITASPSMGADTYLILAGRRWKIIETDTDRKEILVEPSKGGKLPYFSSSLGADIHPCIRAKMKDILCTDDYPVYLDERAKEMLRQARRAARDSGIMTEAFVKDGLDVVWFTWTGSRANRTIALLGKHFAGFDVSDEGIALTFSKADPVSLAHKYQALLVNPPSTGAIASKVAIKALEKYDRFLHEDLLNSMFSRNWLDMPAVAEVIRAAGHAGSVK